MWKWKGFSIYKRILQRMVTIKVLVYFNGDYIVPDTWFLTCRYKKIVFNFYKNKLVRNRIKIIVLHLHRMIKLNQ